MITDESCMLIHAQNDSGHPLHLRYAEGFRAIVLDCRAERGRVLPCLNVSERFPFKFSVSEALVVKKEDRYFAIKESLRSQYEDFAPVSAGEWLGLIGKGSNPEFDKLKPWFGVLPWRTRSAQSYGLAIEQSAQTENSINGLKGGIEHGWMLCGPVSERKLEVESNRLLRIMESIEDQGYARNDSSDGDIRATALVSDDKWVWLVTHGHHRVAVLSALGYDKFPVRINLVIRRDEAEYWPHVVSGLYTRPQALKVFDRIFESRNWHDITRL